GRQEHLPVISWVLSKQKYDSFDDRRDAKARLGRLMIGITHKCGTCGKTFRIKSHLQDHIDSKHNGTGPKCEICGNIFSRKWTVKLHINLVHLQKHNHASDAQATYASQTDNLSFKIARVFPIDYIQDSVKILKFRSSPHEIASTAAIYFREKSELNLMKQRALLHHHRCNEDSQTDNLSFKIARVFPIDYIQDSVKILIDAFGLKPPNRQVISQRLYHVLSQTSEKYLTPSKIILNSARGGHIEFFHGRARWIQESDHLLPRSIRTQTHRRIQAQAAEQTSYLSKALPRALSDIGKVPDAFEIHYTFRPRGVKSSEIRVGLHLVKKKKI
ncbi:unnamed protein product, partial [Trichogramma brassicae]